ERVGGARLLEGREMRALDALLPHPHIARVERDVVAAGAGAEHHHAAALDHEGRDRKSLLARMLEYDVDVAFARDFPNRLAELARLAHPGVVLGRVHPGQLAPAIEVAAVDDALGAELHDVIALALVGHDADGIGARRGRKLHAENAEP